MKTVRSVIIVIILLLGLSAYCSAGEIIDAVQNGDYKTVKRLVKANPEVLNSQDLAGSTPLHIAAINGDKKIVKFLVKKGAEIDAGDNEHTTPLQVAALNGHKDIVEYLIKKGADIHFHDDNGYTALHWAAYRGQLDVADFLIKNGADVNATKSGGSTPLHGAAFYGHPEMIRLLVSRGADMEVRNNARFTPLLSAAAGGQTESVKMLVDKGADLTVMNDWGGDILFYSTDAGNRELVEYLFEAGLKIDCNDTDRRNPLLPAALDGDLEMAQLLMEHGASVNAIGDQPSPLMWASHHQEVELAELLLKHGADPNWTNPEGKSAIFIGVLKGDPELIDVLVENGADVNLTEAHYNRTPLHFAASKGYAEVAKVLVKNRADVNALDSQGLRPLSFARKYGHKQVAELLQKAGSEKDDTPANFGFASQLTADMENGEAAVWYIGHCGYAVKTQNHFMVFDYWNPNRMADEPHLANGNIVPAELKDQNMEIFVSHDHGDHFDSTIFAWKDQIENIEYIFGFEPERLPAQRPTGYHGESYTYTAPREQYKIDGMKVNTIRSNDGGVGFLVAADGVTVWFAADHAGWDDDESKAEFIQEIDYLAEQVNKIDIALVNVTGCRHSGHPDELFEGNMYTVQKLNPNVVIPTHGLDNEFSYKEFADKVAEEKYNVKVFAPENRGDRYDYTGDTRLSLETAR